MPSDVSSWFIGQARSKTARPHRRFLLGTSEYTDHVTKWPVFKTKWDEVRPKSAQIVLANEDQTFNFMREDKTKLTIAGTLTIGFDIDNSFKDPNLIDSSTNWTMGAPDSMLRGQPDHLGTTSGWVYTDSNTTFTTNFRQTINSSFTGGEVYMVSLFSPKRPMVNSTYHMIRMQYNDADASDYERMDFKFRLDDQSSFTFFQNSRGYDIISGQVGSIHDYSDSWWHVQCGLKNVDSNMDSLTVTVYPAIGESWATIDLTAVGSMGFSDIRLDLSDQFNEQLTAFAGTTRQISYQKGAATITLTDKVEQLSERVLGDNDAPVDFTGSDYLLSDLAWYIVTSHGGFSAIESSSNPDIDYDAFAEWAAVMSGDTVLTQAIFDGQKCTEALRKIARMSRSAIYIEEDKLVFNRFSNIASPTNEIDETSMVNGTLKIRHDNVINKFYVNADYDTGSSAFGITVFEVKTGSVNSFGLHEESEDDENFWYVNSDSALLLAQRILFTNGEPQDQIDITAPLNMLPDVLGDSITYTHSLQGVFDNYRMMEKEVDMNKLAVKASIDKTHLVDPFILDVTSLDGTEVLS